MAFNLPTTPSAGSNPSTGTTSGGRQQRDTPRTTVGYLNLYVPLADGSRAKLIPDLTLRLYLERAVEAKLVQLVKESKITEEQLASMIQVEFSLARDENAEIEFDLSSFGM